MRNKLPPLNAYVPINLGQLETDLNITTLDADRIRAIFHQMYLVRIRQSFVEKVKEKGRFKDRWVPLNSKILRIIATKRYTKYIKMMEEYGFISRKVNNLNGVVTKNYFPHLMSQHYKISWRLLNNPKGVRNFRKEKITTYKVIKAISHLADKHLQSQVTNDSNEHLYIKLKEMVENVSFKASEAEGYLDDIHNGKIIVDPSEKGQRPYNEYLQLIELVNNGGKVWYSVDKFGGRIHTAYSHLWKNLKPFIYFKDTPNSKLVSLDIANSQPYFSSIVVNADLVKQLLPEFENTIPILKTLTDKKDYQLYSDLCSKGQIYEHWGTLRGTSREKSKKELIAEVMFTPNKRNSYEIKQKKKIFANAFPSVYDVYFKIKALTERDLPFIEKLYTNEYGQFLGSKAYHKNLPCMMQRIESIVVKKIADDLLINNVKPFITIHDSFIVPEANAVKTKDIMINCFNQLGVQPPTIKTEILTQITKNK